MKMKSGFVEGQLHLRRPIDRAARVLTIVSAFWLLVLWFLEFRVGEHNAFAALLAYTPQHPLGLPVLISSAVSVVARDKRLLLTNAVLTVVFLFAFMGLKVGLPGRADKQMTRVMTWNVNSDRSLAPDVLAVMQHQKPDILCLQEVRSGKRLLRLLKAQGWHVSSAEDVAIATRLPQLSIDTVDLLPGLGRRALHVTVGEPGHRTNIWCVHFGTNMPGTRGDGRLAYVRGIAKSRTVEARQLLNVTGDRNTVIAGDFNMPPRGIAYRRIEARYRNAFDAGTGFGYTFVSYWPALRIDHIFMSRDLNPVSCRTVETQASDHLPVVAEVRMSLHRF